MHEEVSGKMSLFPVDEVLYVLRWLTMSLVPCLLMYVASSDDVTSGRGRRTICPMARVAATQIRIGWLGSL